MNVSNSKKAYSLCGAFIIAATLLFGAPEPALAAPRCDSFTASANVIDEGERVTLRWRTTGAGQVRISPGVGLVALDGSAVVRPVDDTLYTLIASRGDASDTCTVHVDVLEEDASGTDSLRCTLFRVSESVISAGERVTLYWWTSGGSELVITDDRGRAVFQTTDDDATERGDIVVSPSRSTEYTLLVQRGSRENACTAYIELEGDMQRAQAVSLASARGGVRGDDGEPLTAPVGSISLTQVPYTGATGSAGFPPGVFNVLLALWAACMAYVFVLRRGAALGLR